MSNVSTTECREQRRADSATAQGNARGKKYILASTISGLRPGMHRADDDV